MRARPASILNRASQHSQRRTLKTTNSQNLTVVVEFGVALSFGAGFTTPKCFSEFLSARNVSAVLVLALLC